MNADLIKAAKSAMQEIYAIHKAFGPPATMGMRPRRARPSTGYIRRGTPSNLKSTKTGWPLRRPNQSTTNTNTTKRRPS